MSRFIRTEKFKEQGYYIARRVVSKDVIARLQSEIHDVFKLQLRRLNLPYSETTGVEDIFRDFQTLYSKDLSVYLASLRLCAKLCSVYQLYLHENMMQAAREAGIAFPVFQTQPVFHLMAEKLRIADGYFGVGAHQDWPALQSGLDTVTTWMPMSPVKKNSFTLELMPGSHLLGLVPASQEQHIHEVDPKVYGEREFLAVEMEPGDALFFSTFLIHKSETEGCVNGFRMAFSMRYENAANPYFVAKSFPFAQKRVVERELKEEIIPSYEEIVDVYRPSERN